ncbi:MAG: hypothetical protein KDB60_18640 [Propionibacteriaceae bacterium]|nr:hypothetical protein [Propionibacteriaceae bacterium]
MKNRLRLRILGALTIAGALAFAPGAAIPADAAPHPAAYICSGGEIPSNTYASLTVIGDCSVAQDAVINVRGNVLVAAGATLDAQSFPSTITVGHNVVGGAGSMIGLGCQSPADTGNTAHPCTKDPEGHSTITVRGNITIAGAALVALNGITVKGNVTVRGGGPHGYWSVKNNTIGRNLDVGGMTVEWIGVMFNRIGGNAILARITVNDEHPDAPGVYVVQNTVGRNLICMNLIPGVSGGFAGLPNVVGHRALGQCKALAG